jgi:peroxiredoxin
MATESNVLALGAACPDFSLPSVDGKQYTLQDFSKSRGLLVAFICNHCPYVKAIENRLIDLAKAFSNAELQVIGICSNDASLYPEDAPLELLRRWQQKNYGFPYLVDEGQEVARAFVAACTPDLYLYDQERKLYYLGRLDDNWKDATRVKSHDLRAAVDGLMRGEPPLKEQINAIGCSIKWKG